MNSYNAFTDTGRSLLRMTGADARAVLQSIVTNDVDALGPQDAVYAALLTPQGKYLFDFFLIAARDDILIDVEAGRADALIARIKMYCLRRDARIATDEAVGVRLVWPGEGGSHHPPPPPPPGQAAIVVADPRCPGAEGLGWRIYAPLDLLEGEQTDQTGYHARRVALCVPTSGVELLPDDTYILEAGFERLNGVDFSKGCYVGQEVTARMKHKTTLRKGLVRVAVTGSAPVGSELTANGKPAGRLFTQSDGAGLAHLRFDRAEGEMQADGATVTYRP
ncbi:MAG: folate-binding protein [Pseudomonadota bacterium]